MTNQGKKLVWVFYFLRKKVLIFLVMTASAYQDISFLVFEIIPVPNLYMHKISRSRFSIHKLTYFTIEIYS